MVDDFGELRSAVHAQPSARAWDRMRELVDRDLDDAQLGYLRHHLAAWPRELTRPQIRRLEHWLAGGPPPPSLAVLSHLDLSARRLDAAALGALRGGASIVELDVSSNRLDAVGVAVLLSRPLGQGLRALDLSYNPVGDLGIEAIATSSAASTLRCLTMRSCYLLEASAHTLARSTRLGALVELDLGANAIGHAGARALADSTTLAPELCRQWRVEREDGLTHTPGAMVPWVDLVRPKRPSDRRRPEDEASHER